MEDGMVTYLLQLAWMDTIGCFLLAVAFGFFEGESKDSWTWFLLQLRKAIGQPCPLAIHCDASKGLVRAVKDVFPQAEMRECFTSDAELHETISRKGTHVPRCTGI
jgi:hypothetical protein